MSTAEAPLASGELETELVGLARTHLRSRFAAREQAVGIALAAAVALAAAGTLALVPAGRTFSPPAAAVAVAAYALVSRVEFEISYGRVHAGQLVLVPLLFALPARTAPLLVAAALLLAYVPDLPRGRAAAAHVPMALVNAAHALGPALVLCLAGATAPRWGDAPLYLAALASQFACDFAPSAIWSRSVYGIPLVRHAASMRVPALVDTALAPVGLAVAIAADGRIWGVLAVLPLVALLRVFARERQVRIDHALELTAAYRGTAMLLGDVIEADDAYTGSHSRDVVDLALAVCDRLVVDPGVRRRAELGALLHDVGKVKIPSEVINKPGPLDAEERALMETHTIVGEEMLATVGGLLGEVGAVVRSSHERWDGSGYPDGLAGEAIPLGARVVAACDAWSAMTTDRSYRRALTPEAARTELRRCAGTHFDPRVVEALLSVVE